MENNSMGSTLRKLRDNANLSVKDVITELKIYGQDISDKTLYSYESGKRAASADMLLSLCQIYKCTNVLETFSNVRVDYTIPTDDEWQLIEKYRSIDEAGRNHIVTVLSWEIERIENSLSTNNDESLSNLWDDCPATPEELEAMYPPIKKDNKKIG